MIQQVLLFVAQRSSDGFVYEVIHSSVYTNYFDSHC